MSSLVAMSTKQYAIGRVISSVGGFTPRNVVVHFEAALLRSAVLTCPAIALSHSSPESLVSGVGVVGMPGGLMAASPVGVRRPNEVRVPGRYAPGSFDASTDCRAVRRRKTPATKSLRYVLSLCVGNDATRSCRSARPSRGYLGSGCVEFCGVVSQIRPDSAARARTKIDASTLIPSTALVAVALANCRHNNGLTHEAGRC